MENKKPLSEYTDEELLQEEKKLKEQVMYNPFIIGLLVGVAVWSIVKNGFGFLLVILFAAVFYLISADKKHKAFQTEIASRKPQ